MVNVRDIQDRSEKEILLILVQEIDEIKRYVAGTFSNVDTEIKELLDHVNALRRDVKDNDRQLDRMEAYERKINNIESICKKLDSRVR